jgi:hypothetical protein
VEDRIRRSRSRLLGSEAFDFNGPFVQSVHFLCTHGLDLINLKG